MDLQRWQLWVCSACMHCNTTSLLLFTHSTHHVVNISITPCTSYLYHTTITQCAISVHTPSIATPNITTHIY